ncbi:unnamed protein product [Thlaspi arvense]|uniref:Cytochrome P450 n=1 Tax=Thlaspi arvense TaxID=13288 RepID=A0AAU9RSQ3_THLAR|nr:unnamed protein product [Thlaspi arvense]
MLENTHQEAKTILQVRSVCVLHLLSHKMVQSFRIVREEETTLMVEKIRGSSVVNLSDMLVSLTNSVISRVTLGRNYWEGEASNEIMYVNQENEKANEFSSSDFEQKSKKTKSSVSLKGGWKLKEMIGRLAELLGVVDIGVYIPWLSWLNRINGLDGKAEKLAREFDEFIEAVVAEHVHGRRRECNKALRFNMTIWSLGSFLQDMFGAGTDTTFTLLEWTVAELLKHQETMKKLQKEVKEIGRGKRYIAEDDLEKMHYLKAVIKECLRLHTPLPILLPRESLKDVRVMGYDIDAGTQVLVNVRAIARDPSSWEHPEEFRPERFLNSSIDFKGKDFEFIPFGAGRRGCPGTLFAINVTELALANIVYKFDLSLPDGASSEDLDMSEGTGITIHRKNPLIVLAAERL